VRREDAGEQKGDKGGGKNRRERKRAKGALLPPVKAEASVPKGSYDPYCNVNATQSKIVALKNPGGERKAVKSRRDKGIQCNEWKPWGVDSCRLGPRRHLGNNWAIDTADTKSQSLGKKARQKKESEEWGWTSGAVALKRKKGCGNEGKEKRNVDLAMGLIPPKKGEVMD